MAADANSAARIVTWSAPAGEQPSADYAVTVNEREVFCYTSYQFIEEASEHIAGRPVSPVSFGTFDMDGTAEITVRFLSGLAQAGIDTSRVTVRPLAHGLSPAVTDGAFSFRISEPCQLSIEPGGSLLHPLHLFANPIEKDPPDPEDPKVHYFGPGEHSIRDVMLTEGETMYVAGGAVVHLLPQTKDALDEPHSLYGQNLTTIGTMVEGKWTKNITLRGRGILCGRRALARNQRGGHIRIQGVDGLTVEGLILRECSGWSLNIVNCRNVHVDGVKVVGHYVNNDGIVVGGTSEALVENCFSHNADDSLEVKAWIPQRNVLVRHCVVWNSVGGSLGLMHETGADVTNVVYEDCTVNGKISNVLFRNIRILSCRNTDVVIMADGPESGIRNVTFENVLINGTPLRPGDPRLKTNAWVADVKVISPE